MKLKSTSNMRAEAQISVTSSHKEARETGTCPGIWQNSQQPALSSQRRKIYEITSALNSLSIKKTIIEFSPIRAA